MNVFVCMDNECFCDKRLILNFIDINTCLELEVYMFNFTNVMD